MKNKATIKNKATRKTSARKFLKRMFGRKIVIVAAVIAMLFILMALLAPVISPYDPNATNYGESLKQPSWNHLLGTDEHGRDIFSRIVYGSQVSLIVGIVAVLFSAAVGTFIGMVSGYFGGVVDMVIMRICETFRSIPQIILAMALATVFGSGMQNLILILGVGGIPFFVTMMRAQVLCVREADYITAASVQGTKKMSLMMRHILPNSISPIIVMSTQSIGSVILAEAGLSFIGVGVSVPMASWGAMVSYGRNFLTHNPVLALSPGICIILLVMSFNILGDGLRDALDPRLKGEL